MFYIYSAFWWYINVAWLQENKAMLAIKTINIFLYQVISNSTLHLTMLTLINHELAYTNVTV